MSSSEFEPDDSDQEVNENHDRLVQAAKNLYQVPKIEKYQRGEISQTDSKYHLNKTTYESNEWNTQSSKLSKKTAKKEPKNVSPEETVLPKPLEKPVAERIQRKTGYENVKTDLKKWNAIVARNRTAGCVSFPISHTSIKMEPSDSFVKRFRIKSDLQMKMEELKQTDKEENDEKDEGSLTLQEIIEKQREIAKFKRQQDYQAAKARRQNKIKSKKFHRIQRKARTKQTIADFEKLRVSDPEAALKKLQEIDNVRAVERATLRHRNTGKWAQNQQIKAKYDKETRQVLAEQLAVSRELTQKVKQVDSDEEIGDEPPVPLPSSDKENPWMYPVKTDTEITDFISDYRKYWDEKNKDKTKQSETNKKDSVNGNKSGKGDKLFEVPEISDSTVENGVNEDSAESESEKNQIADKKQKKKNLQKTEKDKLGIKSLNGKVTKVKKSKVKVGKLNSSVDTENLVEPVSKENIKGKTKNKKSLTASVIKNVSNNLENMDIDEMFDCMENRIQGILTKKLKKKQRQLLKEEMKEKKVKKKNKKKKNGDDDDEIKKLELKGQQIARPIITKSMKESTNTNPEDEEDLGIENITNISDFNKKITSQPKTPNNVEIDPNQFLNTKPKYIKTALPDEACEAQDALDDDSEPEEEQGKIISEAFVDDNAVDDFRKEKEQEIKNSQPEDIDLTLPGWGCWGGKNIKVSKRKSRRFMIKFPKKENRLDENKGNVVIIEEKNCKIKKHLVNEVPFPFKNVEDYEASMRAPIGREFVPEKVFSKLTTPAVKTKMGKIIEPMTADVLVNITSNLKKRKKQAKKGLGETQKVNKSQVNKTSKADKIGKKNKGLKSNAKNSGKKVQKSIKA